MNNVSSGVGKCERPYLYGSRRVYEVSRVPRFSWWAKLCRDWRTSYLSSVVSIEVFDPASESPLTDVPWCESRKNDTLYWRTLWRQQQEQKQGGGDCAFIALLKLRRTVLKNGS